MFFSIHAGERDRFTLSQGVWKREGRRVFLQTVGTCFEQTGSHVIRFCFCGPPGADIDGHELKSYLSSWASFFLRERSH